MFYNKFALHQKCFLWFRSVYKRLETILCGYYMQAEKHYTQIFSEKLFSFDQALVCGAGDNASYCRDAEFGDDVVIVA